MHSRMPGSSIRPRTPIAGNLRAPIMLFVLWGAPLAAPANLVSKLRTAGKVSLHVQGPIAEIEKALVELNKAKKVTHESTENDWEHFSILVDSGSDARARISGLCRDQNWPLRELHRHDATLEDVFVELTRKD